MYCNTLEVTPWIPPVLGSRYNTCQHCRVILQTRYISTPTSTRFNKPYLPVCMDAGPHIYLMPIFFQCAIYSPKGWWFFYDYMPPAVVPPLPDSLQTQADMSRGLDDLTLGTRSCRRPCNGSKSSCESAIQLDTDSEPQKCGRVVARLCDNQLCKWQCECKGGCQLH